MKIDGDRMSDTGPIMRDTDYRIRCDRIISNINEHTHCS
jgi:hypothetical protein